MQKKILLLAGLWAFSTLNVGAQSGDRPANSFVLRLDVANNYMPGGGRLFNTTFKGLGSTKPNFALLYQHGYKGVFCAAGLGVSMHEFRFSSPLLFIPQPDRLSFQPDTDPAHSNEKAKFQLIYVTLPLELGYQKDNWRLSIGGNVGVQAFAKHKRKYTEAGAEVRQVISGNDKFFTHTVQVSLEGRISYRGLGFFAGYTPTQLFQTDKAPLLHMVQVGFSLSSQVTTAVRNTHAHNTSGSYSVETSYRRKTRTWRLLWHGRPKTGQALYR